MTALPRRNRVTASQNAGFTLLELLAALTVVGLVLAVSIPSTVRFYDSIQYRQSIRDTVTVLASARHEAVTSGVAQDVLINPRERSVRYGDTVHQLPEVVNIAVHSAQEVNRQDEGVIRFYPEGGSSGGGVDIERPGGGGVSIQVDWLVGRVTHETFEIN